MNPEEWMKVYGVTDHYTEGHTMKAGEAILIPIKDLESLITTSLIEEYEDLILNIVGQNKSPIDLIRQRLSELKGTKQ